MRGTGGFGDKNGLEAPREISCALKTAPFSAHILAFCGCARTKTLRTPCFVREFTIFAYISKKHKNIDGYAYVLLH